MARLAVEGCLPGIFRGAMDVTATDINDAMEIAAAYAIADLIKPEKFRPEYILSSTLNDEVVPREAAATSKAALDSG